MPNDLDRKTLRHFYCSDNLWHAFERLSESLDRGVDELVNEAMKTFAQAKGALSQEGARPGAGRPLPPPPPPPVRPPLPPPPPAQAAPDTPPPPLYLVFGNERHVIDKDQFIIGRGAKSSDLAIRDGNISRKHAAVIRRNGAYYMKDLGSTNGIDFNGTRIDNKRIEEGDIYSICEYRLKFTYK